MEVHERVQIGPVIARDLSFLRWCQSTNLRFGITVTVHVTHAARPSAEALPAYDNLTALTSWLQSRSSADLATRPVPRIGPFTFCSFIGILLFILFFTVEIAKMTAFWF